MIGVNGATWANANLSHDTVSAGVEVEVGVELLVSFHFSSTTHIAVKMVRNPSFMLPPYISSYILVVLLNTGLQVPDRKETE